MRRVTEDAVMAMGRRQEKQQGFWIATQDLPSSPGHPFYQQLNKLLDKAGFDAFCEEQCGRFYAEKMGRPSIRPGIYFRMLMIGYFEKLDSERQIAWRCADSLSLRSFLRIPLEESEPPDHSSLSRIRQRIDEETHQAVFDWVLKRLAEHGLLKGKTIGIDASTMEANAAMRSIVRKDTGETYREYLTELAKASGIETPTAEDLAKFDRKRKDKTCSNDDWESPNDPDAKVTKMKDGRTHLAHKPEHAVDLETGAILAVEIHPADQGDTTTIYGTLEKAASSVEEVREDPTVAADTNDLYIQEVVADKGYHSGQTLVDLEDMELRGYISEPDRGTRRWTAQSVEDEAFKRDEQAAVYRNRRRRRGNRSKRLHRKRGEFVERTFEHVLDDGGMRRAHLCGREKITKRYLIHVAAFNLGLILRALLGFGTPKGWADAVEDRLLRCARVLGSLWKGISTVWAHCAVFLVPRAPAGAPRAAAA